MKKINKSLPPNALTQYAERFPNNSWEPDFRNHNSGQDYKQIKQLMIGDQGGLCGYCEKKIESLAPHKQRVEHYHAKSDDSDPRKNWALDWQNILAVCVGGNDANRSVHQLPENLSCDSHKDHLITRGKLSLSCEEELLNPLQLPSANLFSFDKSTGQLFANPASCQKLEEKDAKYERLTEQVERAIEILNLNCQRLCDDRLEILKRYNREIAKARKARDRQGFQKLAERWFHHKWPSFFSTRRSLLGAHAERYLQQIPYHG